MAAKNTSSMTSTTPFQSSSSAGSAHVEFLSLPPRIRNKIYMSSLIVPHPLYLFQEPGCRVELFAPDRPRRWPALLYTNRQISREASAMLYGINHFHLIDATEKQLSLLESFLDCIGDVNAASLSHLDINFPVVEDIDGKPGQLRLRDDSSQILGLIKRKCTKLRTLETIIHTKNSGILKKPDDFLGVALPLIDAQFRAIPSVKKIIVRVMVHDVYSTSANEKMEALGWVVKSGDKE